MDDSDRLIIDTIKHKLKNGTPGDGVFHKGPEDEIVINISNLNGTLRSLANTAIEELYELDKSVGSDRYPASCYRLRKT